MTIKQISIFVENKPGKLSAVTKLLSESNIDIRALSIADTKDFGILRLIVNKPDEAKVLLREIGVIVKIADVVAVPMEDTPGGLSKILSVFAKSNMNVDYMYAFVGAASGKALMVVKVSDAVLAEKALDDAGIPHAEAKDIYRL